MTFPFVPLRRVARILNGGTPPSGVEDLWDGGVPFVTPPDLNGLDGAPLKSTARTITADGAVHSGLAPPGSVLLSTRAPIGHIARLTSAAAFNQGCRALVSAPGHEARFLAYALVAARAEMNVRGLGTTFLELSGSALAQLELPVAPPDDQRLIADYLDRETAQIDAFIAKNDKLITLLAERRRATIDLAVAPAELPAGWRLCQVRHLYPDAESGVSVNGYSIPVVDGEIGVLRTGAVSKGYFDPSENKRVVTEDLDRVAAPVRSGTLIVTRANTPDLVGSAGYAQRGHPNLFLSDKLWQITFREASAAYMHYWTLSKAYRAQLSGLSVGASPSMQNLSYADFLSASIVIPPIKEQWRIVKQLDRTTRRIDDAAAVAKRGVDLARERRAALISAAVTGKIDVREEA